MERSAGLLRLRWLESGGPPVGGPPTRRGFGTRALETTLRDQLAGTIAWRWGGAGLDCEMTMPLARVLAAEGAPVTTAAE